MRPVERTGYQHDQEEIWRRGLGLTLKRFGIPLSRLWSAILVSVLWHGRAAPI